MRFSSSATTHTSMTPSPRKLSTRLASSGRPKAASLIEWIANHSSLIGCFAADDQIVSWMHVLDFSKPLAGGINQPGKRSQWHYAKICLP